MSHEDLQIWLDRQQQGLESPFEGVTYYPAGEIPPSVRDGYLEPTYLSAAELERPDIAANVAAHRETVGRITWAAEDDDGVAWGYWLGPVDVPVTGTVVVTLDSEGSYWVREGRTLTEALWAEFAELDDNAEELAQACAEAGVTLTEEDPADLEEPDVQPTPGSFHEARYEAHLAAPDA